MKIVDVIILGFLFIQVRNQDAVYGLSGVSWEGREVAWKWLQEKWEYIGNTWGSGFLLTRFISAVVSPVCSSSPLCDIHKTAIDPLADLHLISLYVDCLSLRRLRKPKKWRSFLQQDQSLRWQEP